MQAASQPWSIARMDLAMTNRLLKCAIVAHSLLLGAATPALAQTLAQTWPAKTVRIVVPFGSGVDAGYRGAPGCRRAATEISRQCICHREQTRRQRQYRNRRRRKGRARRLDSRREHRRPARHQHLAVCEPAVRPSQGHRARHPTGHPAERARGQSGPWRQYSRRTDRCC